MAPTCPLKGDPFGSFLTSISGIDHKYKKFGLGTIVLLEGLMALLDLGSSHATQNVGMGDWLLNLQEMLLQKNLICTYLHLFL